MKKPFIRLVRWSKRSAERDSQVLFCAEDNAGGSCALPEGCLDELSCFETLRVYDGGYFRLEEHLRRLTFSCEGVGRVLEPSLPWLAGQFGESLRLSGMRNALVRLSLHWPADSADVFCLWFLREFDSYPDDLYRRGVAAAFGVVRRDLPKATNAQIKSSQYVGGVLSALDAPANAAHEIFFLDSLGYVAEGSISNLFIVDRRKCLLTPCPASGILKGVTRDFVLELARSLEIPVLETTLTRHDIYSAAECFLTNTSSEILPVVKMDARTIGDGSPGPVTARLRAEFKKRIRSSS